MGSILIVYASHYGQTRAIAERIAQDLREGGHAVQLANVHEPGVPSPAPYDAIVIGSRIELAKHSHEIRDYVRKHLGTLRRIPSAFFSVSMSATETANKDPKGYMKTFLDELSWQPSLKLAIGGALPYRSYNWFLRAIMKQISKREGHPTDTSRDYVFTDWARVDEFAAEISRLEMT